MGAGQLVDLAGAAVDGVADHVGPLQLRREPAPGAAVQLQAQVQVHADLDVDKATEEQLAYAKKGTPLQTTKETESLKGSGGTTGGNAGATANLPTYAQNAASGSG